MEMIQGKIKLKFGKPNHGWLLTNLKCKDYELELDISNVPNDPVDDLRSAIMTLSLPNYQAWEPQEIILHLEPACYYLLIERKNDEFNVLISKSKDYDSKRYPLQVIRGNYDEVLMPIYRGLMEFYSFGYEPPHWRKNDDKLIDKLKKHIKK